ncbi:MAG: MotA/TolQ/ExbB proton channel family protein [Calditrichia bacterium]
MVELYLMGGAFMHPILLLLIMGIALGIFKLLQLLIVRGKSRTLLNGIGTVLKKDTLDAALGKCEKTPGPIASVLHAGLIRYQKGGAGMSSTMSAVGDIEYSFLERGLSWLNFIIVVAPLLGFTGTVWGMVVAFEQISLVDDVSPAIVAGGISQALLTTLFGLLVAMIVHFFHNLTSAKLDKILTDMEEAALSLMERLDAY